MSYDVCRKHSRHGVTTATKHDSLKHNEGSTQEDETKQQTVDDNMYQFMQLSPYRALLLVSRNIRKRQQNWSLFWCNRKLSSRFLLEFQCTSNETGWRPGKLRKAPALSSTYAVAVSTWGFNLEWWTAWCTRDVHVGAVCMFEFSYDVALNQETRCRWKLTLFSCQQLKAGSQCFQLVAAPHRLR